MPELFFTAVRNMLGRRLILPFILISLLQQVTGQDPYIGYMPSEARITTCNYSFTLSVVGHAGGGEGNAGWFSLPDTDIIEIVERPDNRFIADVSIEYGNEGIYEIWYREPNGTTYNFEIEVKNPPNFTLYDPGPMCGNPSVVLELSRYDEDYNYDLYHDGNKVESPDVNVTATSISWTVTNAGDYYISISRPEATYFCTFSTNTVNVIVGDFPVVYEVSTPEGNEFCAGLTTVLQLDQSEIGTFYLVYRGEDPVPGTYKAGSDGNPVTWDIGQAGTYRVKAFASSGCELFMDGEATIDELDNPLRFPLTPLSSSFCFGSGSQVELILTDSEIDTDYTLLRNDSELTESDQTGDGDPVSWNTGDAGIYTVKATDANGCTAMMSNDAVVTAIRQFSLSASAVYYCEGDDGVTLTLNGSQTVVNYRLIKIVSGADQHLGTKQGSGSELVWNNMPHGIYRVDAVKDGVTCSSNQVEIEMVSFGGGVVDEAPPICLGQSVELKASGGEFYHWEPATGLSETTISNPSAAPDVTTTYTVTVTDDKNCSVTESVTVTVNSLPEADAGSDATICAGETVQLHALEGDGYLYQWKPDADLSDPTVPNPVASPSETTPYELTVTNTEGCKATDHVTVTVNPLPTVNTGADKVICEGETATLQVTGNAAGYLWSTGETGQTISVSPASTQIYTVTGTSTLGCSATDEVEVVVSPLPEEFSVTGGGEFCEGEAGVEIGLTGSETGITYNLMLNGTVIQSEVGTDEALSFGVKIQEGTYTVKAVRTNPHCEVLMAGQAVVTKNRLPGTAQQITVSPSTNVCPDTGVTLSVAEINRADRYIWDLPDGTIITGGEETNSLTVRFPEGTGTAEITVRGENDCGMGQLSPVRTITVHELPDPAGPVTGIQDICEGDINIRFSTPLVSNATSYHWTLPSGAVITGTQTTLTERVIYVDFPVGSSSGHVTVTPVNSCGDGVSSELEVTVTRLPELVINAPSGELDCSGSTITLSASSPDDVTWLWEANDGGRILEGHDSPEPEIDMPGTYLVKATKAGTACSIADEVVITRNEEAPEGVAISKTADMITCTTDEITLTASSTSSFNIAWEWTVTEGGKIVGYSGGNPARPLIDRGGRYTVTATNTETQCKSAPVSVYIDEDTGSPDLSDMNILVSGDISCLNKSVTLSTDKPLGVYAGFVWESSEGNISDPLSENPLVDAPGIYNLLVTGSNGCTSEKPAEVLNDERVPVLWIDPPAELNCAVSEIELTATVVPAAATYQWFKDGVAVGVPDEPLTVNLAGTYTLVGTHPESGCPATGEVTVIENTTVPSTVVENDPGLITCDSPSARIEVTTSAANPAFQWYNPSGSLMGGSTTAVIDVTEPGEYRVRVTDLDNHCSSEKIIEINADLTPPGSAITADEPGMITCGNEIEGIYLRGTSSATGVTWSWETPDGNILSGAGSANARINSGGIYNLKVTDPDNGCVSTSQITVSEDKTPPFIQGFINNPASLSCKTSEVRLAGNASGASLQWTGPSGATISNPDGEETLVDTPGIYRLTATDNINGCSSFREVEVAMLTDLPEAVEILPFENLACNNTTTVLEATSSTGSVTFRWEAVDGGDILSDPEHERITVGSAGTYAVFAIHPDSGCEVERTVTVNYISTVPVITFDKSLPRKITCNNLDTGVELKADVSPEGSTLLWSGPGSVDDAGTSNPTVYTPGIYTLTAWHPDTGCETSRTIEVGSDMTPPVISSFDVQGTVTCSTPAITVTPELAEGSWDFQWVTASPGAQIQGSAISKQVVVTAGGSYSLTVTDLANGCSTTETVVVDEDKTVPHIIVDDEPGDITCRDGGLAQLYGLSTTTGVVLSWDGPGNIIDGSTETPWVDLPGDYSLTVTNPLNGCSASATVTVGENRVPPAEPQISTPQELTCDREWTVLEVSPEHDGVDYKWTTTGPGTILNSELPMASVNEPGTYRVTATNRINGCSSYNTVDVSRNSTLADVSISGGPYVLTCETTALTLAGASTEGTDPEWTTLGGHIVSGRTEMDAVISAAGEYTLTVRHPDTGCPSSASVTVTRSEDVPEIYVTSYPGRITCDNSTVTLEGYPTDAGHTYGWSTNDGYIQSGDATHNPVVNMPGTYIITVTDPETGCTTTAGIVVEENKSTAEFVIDTPAQFTCITGQVQLNATVTSGDNDVEYLWATSGGGTIIPGDETVRNPWISSPGTYTLTVTKNLNGCSASKPVTVTENKTKPHISVDENPPMLTCERTEIVLSGNSDTDGAAFWWTSDDGHPVVNPDSRYPRVHNPGWYTLTVTHPETGCTDSRNVEVLLNTGAPHIHIEPGDHTLTCNNPSVSLEGSSNTENVSYVWTGAGGQFVGDSRIINVSLPGNYTLTVTKNATGCTSTASVTVDEDTEPAAPPVAQDAYSCYGAAPSTLEATGENIRWYSHSNIKPENLISTGQIYTPVVTGPGTYYYYVTQTGANGCESTARQVSYIIRDLPEAPAGTGKETCFGSANPQLRATGTNIRWYESPGGPELATGNYYTSAQTAPGTYVYYASQTDEHGCESNLSEVTFIIRAQPAVPVITESELESCAGELNPPFTATGKNIRWYGSITATSHLYSGNEYTSTKVQPGNYEYFVSQTSDYGCESDRAAGTLIINDIPVKFEMTESGGGFCENTAGVPVGLKNSEAGVEYTLWLDQSTVTGNATGTGEGIDFGYQNIPGKYTVTATGDKGCTTQMNGAVSVQVNYLPAKAGSISGQQDVCQSSNDVIYEIDPVDGATHYLWEVPPGTIISGGSNTNSINVDFTATSESGAVRVRAVNLCGVGPVSEDLYVTVSNLPSAAGSITATAFNTEVCRGDEEVIFEVSAITHATSYEWQVPAGSAIMQGKGSRTIKVRFSPEAATGDQTVRVRGVNDCGEGSYSDPHTITVFAPHSVTAGDDQQLCDDNTTLVGSSIPAGGSALWETKSGFAVFSNRNIADPDITSLAMGENSFTYTVTLDACSVTEQVKIYNNQVHVNAGSNRVACSEELALQGSVPPEGTTGLWTVVGGSAVFADATRHDTQVTGLSDGDNIFKWTITKNGCTSTDEVIITNHRPTNVNAGNSTSTCNGEAYLSASTPDQGQGEWQVISGTALFDDPSDPRTRAYNLGKGDNRLAWVVRNHNCTLSDEITVTNIALDITAGEDQELCSPQTTLNGTIPSEGATGEWSVARGAATFMHRDEHDTRVTGLSTGINEVIWTITINDCKFSESVILTNNMPTQANAGPDQEITVNQAQLEANDPVIGTGMWSVMNGSGTFSDPGHNAALVTELSPGPNTYRWTIVNNGCESTSDVTINNGSLESIYAGEDQTLCNGETRLDATEPPFGFGVWTVRQGSARFGNNEQANTSVYDLGRGDNVLRWSVIIGSTEYYDEVTITNNMPTIANAGTDRSLCSSSFTLTGNEPLTGNGIWTIEGGSAAMEDPLRYNTPVSNLAQGNNMFRWTITNENCVSSDMVVISNDIPTTPDAGEDQFSCDGTAELFPNTPTIGTGEWSVISGSGSFDDNFVSNLANGENRLQYTIRNNQCTLSDELVITNYKPTAADAGYNMHVCEDEADLNANQPNTNIGETARWTVISGSGTFEDPEKANTSVSGLAPGRNVFRWTIDNQGCTSYDEIEVSYDYISASAGHDITTCDNEVLLNANNPGNGAGEWTVRGGSGSAVFESPNNPNTHVSGLERGNNILRWTITNNRCISWDEITVRNSSPSDAYAGSDQITCTDSLQLSARNPVTGTGTWSVINGSGQFENEGQHNTLVRGAGPGVNTFRWTVQHEGCTSADEVVIRNNKPLDTFAGVDQVLCDDSAVLTANKPDEGTGVWSIAQGAGAIQDAYSNETVVSSLAPDENILRWTVNNGQCSDYSDIIIVNNKPSTALAGADRVICSDETTLEGNIPLEGTGRWSVISGSGTFEDAEMHNSSVTRLSRGRNILRWTITKENCSSISDVVIRNDMPSIPNAGANIAVCDNQTPLNGNMPAIGTGEWSLVSGSGSFDDPHRSNTTARELGQGTNVLRWTITNNNCSLSDEVEVRNNMTDVYAGPDQLLYENNVTLSGNTPARGSGLWLVDAGGGDILNASSPETRVEGIYEGVNTFIWSVDIDGCISSDEVRITYYRQPVSSFSVSSPEGCPPLQVRFTKTTTDNYPFRWDLGEQGSETTEDNPVYTFEKPGKYAARLYITGADGQEVVSERTITVHDPPVASFELAPTELFIPGNELRTYNYSYNSEYYLWEFGDGNTSDEINPVHTYKNEGEYDVSLEVWSAEGCNDSMTFGMPVTVTQTTRVRFPSAFTPNEAGSSGGRFDRNDFTNHVFFPVIINGNIDSYRLEIFNRWGVKLYESTDIEIGWDGYYKGQLVSEDVYVFRVTGSLNNGEKFTETGDFLLMRRD